MKLVSKNVTKCNGNVSTMYKNIPFLKSLGSKAFFENIDLILCPLINSAGGYDLKRTTVSI